MWINEFESEHIGKNGLSIYEPLETKAPTDAHPYCCYLDTVIFYTPDFPRTLTKVDEVTTKFNLFGQRFTTLSDGFAACAPFVKDNGVLYELCSGAVVLHRGMWYMHWTARRVADDDPRLRVLTPTEPAV